MGAVTIAACSTPVSVRELIRSSAGNGGNQRDLVGGTNNPVWGGKRLVYCHQRGCRQSVSPWHGPQRSHQIGNHAGCLYRHEQLPGAERVGIRGEEQDGDGHDLRKIVRGAPPRSTPQLAEGLTEEERAPDRRSGTRNR